MAMKALRVFLWALIVSVTFNFSTVTISTAVAQEVRQDQGNTNQVSSNTETKARRQFLNNLGFGDVAAVIRKKLENKEYEHELNRRQMISNVRTYQTLNASRELSLLIMEGMGADVSNDARLSQLIKFSAKMLDLKPLSPMTDYPTEILQMPAGEEKNNELVKWLGEHRRRQMETQTRQIVSDITGLLYGYNLEKNSKNIDRIYKMVSVIVDRMYTDDLIGNAKYFGRALSALLLREEKLAGLDKGPITQQLKTELKEHHNLYLENFFGDTIMLPTQKGIKEVKVQNGTMMLTRNLTSESLTISIAAIPGNLKDRWKARFHGLVGNPLSAPFFVTPEDTKNGMSLWLRIKDRIAQSNLPIETGLSHIVYYQIKEDPETGIKMPRVIDNYPNHIFDITGEYANTGGTRFVYPEQVIDLSHHSAVYISNPNAEKLHAWAQESFKKNGYQSEFFPSVELELAGTEPVKNSNVKNWKTQITEEDFNALNSEKNAKKFSKVALKRFTDGLEQSVYEGWIFHWPDPFDFYLISATYCSQLADMVMRRVNGFSIEQHESSWHWGLKFLAQIGNLGEAMKKVKGLEDAGEKLLNIKDVRKAMKLTKIKIIAPANLVVQPYMDGDLYRLESKSPEQRVQSSYTMGEYRENDYRLTKALDTILPNESFQTKKINPVYDFGSAIRDLQYGMVMRASQGIKTLDFSTDIIAAQGSKKAMAKIENNWKKQGMPNSIDGSQCSKLFAK